jgi:ABC-2 type transport system permease protein
MMQADVAKLDLRLRRRVTLAYTLGMALYTFVIVAIYPSFEHSTSLDNLTKNSPTMAALFGAVGSLTSPSGWLNVNLYANLFPLVVLLATIGYGASCLAGADEDGTLGVVVTLPIRRWDITVQKVVTLSLQAALIVVVTAAVIAFGQLFDIHVGTASLLGASFGVLLLGIDLGLLALLIGALTGSRGVAIGIAAAVATASYLISSLASVVAWIHPTRIASLFYWSVGNNQLTSGLSLVDVFVLVITGIVLTVLSAAAFARLDLH